MSKKHRFDFQESGLKIVQTEDGFLKAIADIARPGVFPYVYENGQIVYEAKLPGDILSSETVASASGAPLTLDHPKDAMGNHILVTPDNAQSLAVGNVSEPEIIDGKIRVLLTALTKEAVEEIRNGKRELSIGFEYDLDSTPGQLDGINYDSAQKNIRINHVALVDRGRAGDQIRIHGDKKQMLYRKYDSKSDLEVSKEVLDELIFLNKKINTDAAELGTLKNKIKADEGEIESLKAQIAGTPLKNDVADKELQKIMAQLDTALAQVEAWKQKYAKLEEEVPAMAEEAATETMDAMNMAKSVDPAMKTDGLSAKEIKLQIIGKILPFKEGVKVDSLDKGIIQARYEAAIELAKHKEKSTGADSGNRSTGLDRNQIEEKRNALSNVFYAKEGK